MGTAPLSLAALGFLAGVGTGVGAILGCGSVCPPAAGSLPEEQFPGEHGWRGPGTCGPFLEGA